VLEIVTKSGSMVAKREDASPVVEVCAGALGVSDSDFAIFKIARTRRPSRRAVASASGPLAQRRYLRLR